MYNMLVFSFSYIFTDDCLIVCLFVSCLSASLRRHVNVPSTGRYAVDDELCGLQEQTDYNAVFVPNERHEER